MSQQSVKFNFHFSDWLYTSFAKLPFTTDPIGQLGSKIQAVEGLQKQQETKKLSALFGYILKSVFASSDSFCLITLQLHITYHIN